MAIKIMVEKWVECEPCPFCGGEDLEYWAASSISGAIKCNQCRTFGPVAKADADEVAKAAVEAWNDRAEF